MISLRSLLRTPGHAAPLAFGVLNGFLPCPLVYAMVAQAASTADVLSGCLTMAVFGLGTFPAMLAMGGLGRLLAPRWRQRGVRLAGGFILALGLITLAPRRRADGGAAMACTISGISHDAAPRRSVPPLPAAGRPAGLRPHGERRGLPVLLLWLLHRPSGEERQRRCVGGGVVPGASRRGQLSVHEHHAVQPAGVLGGVQPVPTGGCCPRFICCSGGSRRRRY